MPHPPPAHAPPPSSATQPFRQPCLFHALTTHESLHIPRSMHHSQNLHSISPRTIEHDYFFEARDLEQAHGRQIGMLQARMPPHVGLCSHQCKRLMRSEQKPWPNSAPACVAK